MNRVILGGSAAIAAVLGVTAATAAPVISFGPGASSAGNGYSVINTFDNANGISGYNFQIKTPPSDGNGAPPANSIPSGTPYLSVLGGGQANINFAKPVRGFQFDWGSLDKYNTLIIHTVGGDKSVVPGTDFANPANGDQYSNLTNGLFTAVGSNKDRITGITLESKSNSFEIDNLAVSGVPEPTSWALMIGGFGFVGGSMRARRSTKLAAA